MAEEVGLYPSLTVGRVQVEFARYAQCFQHALPFERIARVYAVGKEAQILVK